MLAVAALAQAGLDSGIICTCFGGWSRFHHHSWSQNHTSSASHDGSLQSWPWLPKVSATEPPEARIIKMGGARPTTLPAPIDEEEQTELTAGKIGKVTDEEDPWDGRGNTWYEMVMTWYLPKVSDSDCITRMKFVLRARSEIRTAPKSVA